MFRNKFLITFLVVVVLMIMLAYWISQRLIGHIDEHLDGIGKIGYENEIRNENSQPEWRIDLFTHQSPA